MPGKYVLNLYKNLVNVQQTCVHTYACTYICKYTYECVYILYKHLILKSTRE